MAITLLVLTNDHDLIERLRKFTEISSCQDTGIVAHTPNAQAAIRLAGQLCPDVVVLGPDNLRLDVPAIARLILVRHPTAKIVIVADETDDHRIVRLLASGVSGYIRTRSTDDELRQCIDTVMHNRLYVGSGTVRIRPAAVPTTGALHGPNSEVLTPRELEVLSRLANGLTTFQIAEVLYISVKTVETHRGHIMDKLGIRTIAGLTQFAIRHGLIALDV